MMGMNERRFGSTFTSSAIGNPVLFVLPDDLKDREEVSKKIIQRMGVVVGLKDRSMIAKKYPYLADPIVLWDPSGGEVPEAFRREDVFHVKYVDDCIQQGCLLDNLNEYRVNKNRCYEHDPFEVMIGKRRWTDALVASTENLDANHTDNDDFNELPVFTPAKRKIYTKKHQMQILKFIIKEKAYTELKGNSFWKKMQRNGCVERKTWQSLKEHFTKQIYPQLGSFHLKKKYLSRIQRGFRGEQVNDYSSSSESEIEYSFHSDEKGTEVCQSKDQSCQNHDAEENPTESVMNEEALIEVVMEKENSPRNDAVVPEKKNEDVEKSVEKNKLSQKNSATSDNNDAEFLQSTPKETSGITRRKGLRKKRQLFSQMTASVPVLISEPNQSDEPQPSTSRQEIDDSSSCSSSSSHAFIAASVSSTKKQRKDYSPEEDEAIEEYVRSRGLINYIRGNKMWKTLQDEGVLPGRTWQSMKNRFLKKILPMRNHDYFKPASPDESVSRPVGRYYSYEEDKSIIDFIVENRRFAETGGVTLWQEMENLNVVPGRSWQSMKERFRKVLLRQIKKESGQEKFGISPIVSRRLIK